LGTNLFDFDIVWFYVLSLSHQSNGCCCSEMPRGERGAHSVYLRPLPPGIPPRDLWTRFEEFGPVKDVYIPRDFHTRQPKAFG
jgi:hypothetical protein